MAVQWWSQSASLSDLNFLVRPVASTISAFTGRSWDVAMGQGYLFSDLGIIMDRTCSGIHFMVVSWITFAGLFLLNRNKRTIGVGGALLLACAGYLLTLLVNSGRVLSMIWAGQLGFPLGPTQHEAYGGLLYVTSLCLVCILLERLYRPPTTTHALLP